MKKMRWLLVGLLTLVLALGVAACGDKTPTPGPNGDDPKPPVVTPGGDDEPPEKEVITVTGVENNKAYAYGSDVKPTFDKGTATLSRNSGAAAAYTSGTAVTQVGSYLLTVTHDNADTVSVRFSIAPPDTTGQITDEFVDDVPQADYFTDSQISFVGGNLTVSHPADSQAWGISRRKIEHVDVTEWPFVEVRIEKVVNCSATMVLRLEENADEKLDVSFDVAGLYYVDVKTYAEAHGWNMTDQTVWVDCNIVGNANTDMVGVFDYYKSAKEIAPLAPCGVYVDKTAETINTWKAATANIQWFDGDDSATAVITGSEGYGHFDKRVNFNTEEYPFLIVDVMQVVGSWAIKANKYVNYQKTNPQITLIDTTKTGKHEINLQKFFGVSENVDVLLEFYIVGKSDEKTFQLNGLETTADPITDIEISGTADGATVNSAEAGAQVTFDKGTATIRKDGGEAAEYISGTEITEVGSYVVTVKAGTFEHTISFTVVKQVVINTSGIEDGDIINIAWRDRPALTFDKGTATIRKDGSEATEYASGTEITEVGSYVITVTATGAETKTVSFTVFNREVQEGTFEDYCTLNVNTITANNSTKLPNGLYKDYHDDFYIMYDGAAMRMDMTTGNLVYAKVQGQDWSELIKSYTLTFPQSGYFVLAFKPLGGYSPDAMFQFQIKDISGDINYNAATKAVIDKAGVHHVYYEIPEALRGQTNKAITVLVKIQAGPALKEIALHSLGLVNELPEDSPVIVDYGDDAGLTVSSCTKEVAGGGYVDYLDERKRDDYKGLYRAVGV
ncbi:MAG: hypothetical protein HFK10_06300 [Clostridia bacterium]|nr:hypothetical protein [Clostridia bacterium]